MGIYPVGGEPLAIFHVEGNRASVSRVRDWRFSLTWALERKHLFTSRALAAFIATECAAQAETAGWRERALLLHALCGTGTPAIAELPNVMLFLGVPRSFRRACRDWLRVQPARISGAAGSIVSSSS